MSFYDPLPEALEADVAEIVQASRKVERWAEEPVGSGFGCALSVWLALQEHPPAFFLGRGGGFQEGARSPCFWQYTSERLVGTITASLGFTLEVDGDGIERAFRPARITPGWTCKTLAGPRADEDEDAIYIIRSVLNDLGLFPSFSAEIVEYPMLVKHASNQISPPEGVAPEYLREVVEALGRSIGKGGVIERDWD